MLGEMIGEARGKITNVRVLPSEGNCPCMEMTFQATGKLLGTETSDIGTYKSVLTAGGVARGTGQGVLTTKDGDLVTWTGQGVGQPKGKGLAASWRGAIYLETAAPRLAQLNKIALVFEYEVDENGNTHSKEYEWK